MPKLLLGKFDPRVMRAGRRALLVGRTGSGKSTVLERVLCEFRKQFDFCVGYSPTKESQEMFRRVTHDSCVHSEFSKEHFANLVQTLDDLDEDGKYRNLLVLLDDCMYDKSILKGTEIRQAHMNGRHWGMSIVNVVQYLIDMPSDLRESYDYIFAMAAKTQVAKEKLYKQFFGVFPTQTAFNQVFNRFTDHFGCLVLDCTVQSSEPDKCIFYYRADPNDGVKLERIENPVFARLHEEFYLTKEERRSRKAKSNGTENTQKTTKKSNRKFTEPDDEQEKRPKDKRATEFYEIELPAESVEQSARSMERSSRRRLHV